MSYNSKSILLFFIICLLSLLLASYVGDLYVILYKYITGHGLSCGILSFCSNSIEGFVTAFTFFSGLIFLGFLDQKRIKTGLPFALIIPAMSLLASDGDAFIITIAFALIGLGLGQVVYLIRKKLSQGKIKNS